jgi:hypothetical protein
MAATYIWSGLQKCNVEFVEDVYPWLLEPLLSEPARKLAQPAGWLVPVLEAGIGVGLLVPARRRIALPLVLALHATLLYCLGPLGHDWNSVVWPWNLAMMVLASILFWESREVSFQAIVRPSGCAYRWLVLVLFGIMPGLNFLGFWDSYLSAALYSGNLIKADIEIGPTVYGRLPPGVQRYCQPDGKGYSVDVTSWSMAELNVPPYAAPRIYRQIAGSFCALAKVPSDVMLTMHGRPHWLTGERQQTKEDCYSLSGMRGRAHGSLPGRSFRLESPSTQTQGKVTHDSCQTDRARNRCRRRHRGYRRRAGSRGVAGVGPDGTAEVSKVSLQHR